MSAAGPQIAEVEVQCCSHWPNCRPTNRIEVGQTKILSVDMSAKKSALTVAAFLPVCS